MEGRRGRSALARARALKIITLIIITAAPPPNPSTTDMNGYNELLKLTHSRHSKLFF